MSKSKHVFVAKFLQTSYANWSFQRLKHRFTGTAYTLPPFNHPRLKWNMKKLDELTGGNYTVAPLAVDRVGGRNEAGRKVIQHVGGGVKFDYFMTNHSFPRLYAPVDSEKTYDERVLEVRRDPNRSAYIALVAGLNGKRWIVAIENMVAGQIIKSTGYIPHIPYVGTEGMIYKLGALNTGTIVCCIERLPKIHAPTIATKAGSYGTVMRHLGRHTVVRMDYGQEFIFDRDCYAMCGQISHSDISVKQWGSANMHRRFGYKMSSGLWQRKTGYYAKNSSGKRNIAITFNEKVKAATIQNQFTLSNEPGGPLSGLAGTDAVHPLVSKTHYRF